MSELNEGVNVTVDDATVITVPLVTTFTATNAAPTAKAVGDALADKVDTESIMESVRITWNGIESDNQGVILADADDLPVDENNSVKDVLDALDGKTGVDIPISGTDTRTLAEAIAEAGSAAENAVLKTAQTLLPSEQSQARANIDAKCLVVTGTMTTTGSLTIQNANITADMVVANIQLANAGAIPGAMTWSTADGSMSLSCSCYADVGVTVYLVHTA